MSSALFFGVLLAVGVVAYLFYRTVLKTYLLYRGTRIVTCPETGRHVAVEVDATSAAESALLGKTDVHLRDCTRWPERAGCGQECLTEVESAPEQCLLKSILERWYVGKSCALCGREFEQIHWHDHKPCLMNEEGRTVTWSGFAPEAVVEVLATHSPVCWDCHVAEDFRRQFPDLAVDRDWKSQPPSKPTIH